MCVNWRARVCDVITRTLIFTYVHVRTYRTALAREVARQYNRCMAVVSFQNLFMVYFKPGGTPGFKYTGGNTDLALYGHE